MLPMNVRLAVANYDLGDHNQWETALDHADNVYNALKTVRTVKSETEVAAVTLDETAPQYDVAAVTAKEFDIDDRQTWGRYHSDFKRNPPKTICFQHYRWGKQAHFCRGLGECPWESYTAPKSK